MPSHVHSVLQALFVTFLWSTSVILIKTGLETLPSLTFAGLRYGLAFVILLPLALHANHRSASTRLTRADWRRLILLGLIAYTFTQGAQFVALDYLPPATHSMMMNSTSAVVLVIGAVWLSEHPTRLQIAGLTVFFAGIVLYFAGSDFSGTQGTGLAVAAFQVFANAGAAVLGRFVNRSATLSPLLITTISMGVGAVVLIAAGLLTQGLPALDVGEIAIVVWLAGINTAFAFTLWNHTQRTLSAMESSMINSTMLIQVGVLAWVFLGDALSVREVAGMLLAAFGVLLVQVRRLHRTRRSSQLESADNVA
ncbi:MAG: DMT family transporter [Chloroflexi bacterium]|nr:DMT family transporter [Chloroflexota bacterium]